jgi:hypothetical protein
VRARRRRVECKLGQLDEVAAHMQREREQLERMRHQIFAERFSADKRRLAQPAAQQQQQQQTASYVPLHGGAPGSSAAADNAQGASQASAGGAAPAR